MPAPFRVIVVGTGLAGPCLAHRLRKAGIGVELHARDRAVASRGQGYRIHIDPVGELALRRCLPRDQYELVIATSGKPGSGVTIFDPELNELHRVTVGPDDRSDPAGGHHLSVDRLVLRQILLHGLDAAVRHGSAFVRYEELPDGRVRTFFSDGTSSDADVLVAADGAGSLVRKQALPQAQTATSSSASPATW